MNLIKILLTNETPKERQQTERLTQNLIRSTMTNTEKIQSKLLAKIKELGITANQIKDRKIKNPFPIGTKAVYQFAKYGKATDSHKWKLLEYFENAE